MSQTTLPNDTAPLIRLLVGFTVVGSIVIGVSLWAVVGGGPRRPAPVVTQAEAIGELATELAPPVAGDVDAETAVADADADRVPEPEIALPRWIWGPAGSEAVRFTRQVTVPDGADRPHLLLACDNEAIVRIDGREIATTDDWSTPLSLELTEHLVAGAGDFTLEVEARNHGGPAGLLAIVSFHAGDLRRDRVITDASWRVAEVTTDVADAGAAAAAADGIDAEPGPAAAPAAAPTPAPEPPTTAAVEIAAHGDAPWGELPGFDRSPIDRHLAVPDGFVVELVYDVPASQGSWVSLAVDSRGRLVASDQSGGLYRVSPSPPGDVADATRVEVIDLPVGSAQGLLCVEDDLYCVTAGARADGPGVYRIRDLDGDDVYDDWQLLLALNEGGEHGPHGLTLGPDGRLYLVAGNHTRLPETADSTILRGWGEDHLLPRMWDARGHAVGILAPGGWIARMERDGTGLETVAIGFRNSYDLAFDRQGELFTYDSDMEWDLGSPWYRPTRILHVVSGADYGWRSGSGKWPAYYPDTLPATLDLGPGSPTGVSFGHATHFPPPYRDALFVLDWTFGTIWAVRLEPDGATYAATREPFLTGRPMPLADIVANPHDGAMYVVVGGRGVRSAIHRIRAVDAAPAPSAATTPGRPRPLPAAHIARRALEALHTTGPGPDPADLDRVWSALGDADRFIVHAARVALERLPVDAWIDRLRAERDPDVRLSALLALARRGDPSQQAEAVATLEGMAFETLDPDQRQSWLRAAALTFIRLGPPTPEQAGRLRDRLEPHYPDDDPLVTRELCAMLVHLDSPVVVSRTLTLMEQADDATAPPAAWFDRSLLTRNDSYGSVILKVAAAMPQQQQIALATSLRSATIGWTPTLRDRYFGWFESAKRASGGLSFDGFLDRIRSDALAAIPEPERATWELATSAPPAADMPFARGPGRQWTVDALASITPDRFAGRDFENGRDMFEAAMCVRCHRVAGIGGDSGPDLSAVATRFTRRDLIESILEPSRTISSQYESTAFALDDGTLVTGRVVDLDDDVLRVQPSPLVPDHLVAIERARIASRQPSPVSPMMPRLLDPLNEDEVLDLLAYLLAEGDARNPMFRPAP